MSPPFEFVAQSNAKTPPGVPARDPVRYASAGREMPRPSAGYGWIFLIFAGIILLVGLVSHNIVLGNAVALLALPVIVYFATKSTLATCMALAALVIIAVKFAPAAIADMKKRGLKGLGPDEVKAKK